MPIGFLLVAVFKRALFQNFRMFFLEMSVEAVQITIKDFPF